MLIVLTAMLAAAPGAGATHALLLARSSPDARRAMAELERAARSIPDPSLARTVEALLANPAPTFTAGLSDAAARARVHDALVQAGLLDPKVTTEALFPPLADPMRAPQPFLAAPARSEHGHHSYPGGLAEHTAFNLATALALAENYRREAGLTGPEAPNRSIVIAAAILHDAMKPWTLQWNDDGTITPEAFIAGTASHHIFILAEAFHRRLSPELIVAIASAHETPLGPTEAKVVGWIRAGALLAGIDPIEAGVLRRDGERYLLARPPSIEAVVNHLADHDFALTEPATRLTDAALERLIATKAPDSTATERRWARARIEARVAEVRLYAIWQRGGDAALADALARAHVPLVDASDPR